LPAQMLCSTSLAGVLSSWKLYHASRLARYCCCCCMNCSDEGVLQCGCVWGCCAAYAALAKASWSVRALDIILRAGCWGVCVCVCVCHAASDGERRFLPHCWARPTMMMVPPRRRGRGLPSCCLIQVLTALEMHAAKDCLLPNLLAMQPRQKASMHACKPTHSWTRVHTTAGATSMRLPRLPTKASSTRTRLAKPFLATDTDSGRNSASTQGRPCSAGSATGTCTVSSPPAEWGGREGCVGRVSAWANLMLA